MPQRSCMVFGIDGNIFVREVTRPDGVVIVAQPKLQADHNIPALHGCAQGSEVTLGGHSLREDEDVVDIKGGF